MRIRSHTGTAAVAAIAAWALLTTGVAAAATARPAPGQRVVLASTTPVAGQNGTLSSLPAASPVQVSVFTGRDQAGLAAVARAASDPASPDYQHYLSPAQVRTRYGATAAQQSLVTGWLQRSGLHVTHRGAFTISATGRAGQAESMLAARLELNRPHGGAEQVVPAGAMSVPMAVAGAVSTIGVAPAAIPMGRHEPMKKLAPTAPGSHAAAQITEKCSAYYGQKKAPVPPAYGRALAWSPCGYLPQQLRAAYGAARSGLTGAGTSVAILSEDNDSTARADADRWAKARGFPSFKPGQYSANVAAHAPNGIGDGESALDVESVHGMAPAAKVSYVVGNGTITGDRLLDALDTVVSYGIAQVVSSSWYEGYMPVPKSMINAWEGVLERAAVEGITVNFATGDYGDSTPLQYPGSDPWITTVGGTSLAIGARGRNLWETGWETDETGLSQNGKSWKPAPPGPFLEGSTGGISKTFPEPSYQDGVVSGNVVRGKAMRAVPDVSDLGDWNLGYQIGLSMPVGHHKYKYFNAVNGGTSLSSPMFTGFEADLVQGRGGIPLGFANPALYNQASTATFHDVTGSPQGGSVTEADVYGPAYGQAPALSTMGQCSSTTALSCGPGYDTVSGIGSPGPAFFRSFGSHPR
ncbi:MAG TPA: S53 family peptidase [Streptosporangiaceae bacterium]|jgi:subtilase family serine protease